MNAMILGAGLGSRLKSLTNKTPKPLLPIQGKPLLLRILEQFEKYNIKKVIINVHHLADQIIGFVNQNKDKFTFQVITVYEPVLLDTGGAILNCQSYLDDDDFFVYNGDIYSNFDLNILQNAFQRLQQPLAVLVTQVCEDISLLRIDKERKIIEFTQNQQEDSNFLVKNQLVGFCGIHLLNKNIFKYVDVQHKILSIIDVYKHLLIKQLAIYSVDIQDFFWNDIGSLEKYNSLK